MKKTLACLTVLFCTAAPLLGASADTLTQEEEAAVAAILAAQGGGISSAQESDEITLSDATKQQALDENRAEAAAAETAEPNESVPEEEDEAEEPAPKEPAKCLTVAFVDIDAAFNEHPRTVAVKEQIRLKIVSKEDEVRGARQLIEVLAQENAFLSGQMRDLKPFYERIVVEPNPLLPKIEESADTLLLTNVLNRLTFSGAEILSHSPRNTPARLEDLQARIASNKKIIAERSLFIDNYRYATREEILQLEKKEVNAILQDIYTEIKSFAKKRNIGAIVRKDDILYGERPVNVTKDFINRLKKSKKYRKRGK